MDNVTAYKNLVTWLAWLKGFNKPLYDAAIAQAKVATGLSDYSTGTAFENVLTTPTLNTTSSGSSWQDILNSITNTVSSLSNSYISSIQQKALLDAQIAAAKNNTTPPISLTPTQQSALSGLFPIAILGGAVYLFMKSNRSSGGRRGRYA